MKKRDVWIALLVFLLIFLLILLLLWLFKKPKKTTNLPPQATPSPSPILHPNRLAVSVAPDNTLQIKFQAPNTNLSAASVRLTYRYSGSPGFEIQDQNPTKEGIQLRPNLDLIQKNWSFLINSVETVPVDENDQLLIIDLAAAVINTDGFTSQNEEVLASAKLTLPSGTAFPKFKFDPAFTKLIEKKSALELPLSFQD